MGIALADEAARRGWGVTLLLGPTHRTASDSRVRVVRFRTAAELERLLWIEAAGCDVLVMAAAVADYRPKPNPAISGGKFRRTEGPLKLELEPTPDLLAGVSARRRDGQVLVGFALEPREEMLVSARGKLERKGVDLVVGNPLETMDAEGIEAVVIGKDGRERRTPGVMPKERFAAWLLDVIEAEVAGRKS
jgi:phosphopantothenoylcysteine decarboxylase/phosphopantothenate--cysteine ligase